MIFLAPSAFASLMFKIPEIPLPRTRTVCFGLNPAVLKPLTVHARGSINVPSS
jgi:hypothetical protein